MQLSTDLFHWQKDTKCFSAEASDLGLNQIPETFSLTNPKTRISMVFKFTHKDMDSTGEDTYGWNYVSTTNKSITLLIIND